MISEAAVQEARRRNEQKYGLRRNTLQGLATADQAIGKPSGSVPERDRTPRESGIQHRNDPSHVSRGSSTVGSLSRDAQLTAFFAEYRKAFVAPNQGVAITSVYVRYQKMLGLSRAALKEAVRGDRFRNPDLYKGLVPASRRRQERATPRNDLVVSNAGTGPTPQDREPLRIDDAMLAELAESFRMGPWGPAAVSFYETQKRLRLFTPIDQSTKGYLSWRFNEITTHPARAQASVDYVAETITAIVEEDKRTIALLEVKHGSFLNNPKKAAAALDAEFNNLDLGLSWQSADLALRRSRASLGFLRRAVILTFASQDYGSRLLPILARLRPPQLASTSGQIRGHIAASLGNLAREITLIDQLFTETANNTKSLYSNGIRDLQSLRDGALDFVLEPSSDEPILPPAVRLPTAILPPGEHITPFVSRIRNTKRFRGGDVDDGRLTVLSNLWNHLSDYGTCAMYEGAFPAKGRDNGYLILVIAYEGYGEDAVAISPWRHEHATFVVRADAGDGCNWRTVLTSSKKEATDLGARRLLFKSNPDHGIDEYEAMFQKVAALFGCDSAEFPAGAIYFDLAEGRYEVR